MTSFSSRWRARSNTFRAMLFSARDYFRSLIASQPPAPLSGKPPKFISSLRHFIAGLNESAGKLSGLLTPAGWWRDSVILQALLDNKVNEVAQASWQDTFARRHHEKNNPWRAAHVRRGANTARELDGPRTDSLVVLLDKYLEHLAVTGFSESTLRVRRVYMQMFAAWCRKRRILAPARLTRTLLEAYQRFLFQYRKKDGQPLAVASQHARLSPLKVWLRWLAHRKYIPHDPAAELELPRVGYK